jgi:signal transduction histidine kinase
MNRSLRFRLLVQTSIAVAVVLALLGFALDFCARQSADSDFNHGLLTEAQAVAATAEQHGDKIIFDYAPDELPKFALADHPDYFQAWIDPGGVIRSPSLHNGNLPRPLGPNHIAYRDISLPDGRPGRMVGMSFTTTIESNAEGNSSSSDSPHEVLLTVATDTIALHRTLESFRLITFGLCGLAVVISGAILFWVVGRGIRPVKRLAASIDQMNETDLSVRLHDPTVPAELTPVVDKLNGLLSRLESAFAREKAFTADVAHELRNPLAALLTTFDVCRSRPRDEAAYTAAIDKCRVVASQMQTMVETLLTLTRADAGLLQVAIKRIDFSDILSDCWALFQPRAQSRDLKVQWDVPSPIFIDTDPEQLRIILHNIFDNAVTYADDSGSLRVAAQLTPGRLLVEVANTGCDIPAEKIPELFDRFWRGDQARTQTGLHCGLGLSLCQRLSRLLNGQIQIESDSRKWFTVRLSLPAPSSQHRSEIPSISVSHPPPAAPPATVKSGEASS